MIFPAYILTLPGYPGRAKEIQAELASYDFFRCTVIEGVRGGLLPDAACRLLTRNEWSVNHKGALGCFLSHARIWQIVAASSEPVSLVLEDDAILENLDIVNKLSFPVDCDVVFCNSRTSYDGKDCSGHHFRPVNPMVSFSVGHGQAIGTDGYFITPKGAAKLLKYVESDSFFTHVDLRMAAYSLTDGWEDISPIDSRLVHTLKGLRQAFPADHRITSYSLHPPISRHAAVVSRRQMEDEQNATRRE